MIHLHLALIDDKGDVPIIECPSQAELVTYLHSLRIRHPNAVWLAKDIACKGDDSASEEIVVSESIINIAILVESDEVFNIAFNEPEAGFFVCACESYEDAYALALDMREGNPKCYETEKD